MLFDHPIDVDLGVVDLFGFDIAADELEVLVD